MMKFDSSFLNPHYVSLSLFPSPSQTQTKTETTELPYLLMLKGTVHLFPPSSSVAEMNEEHRTAVWIGTYISYVHWFPTCTYAPQFET